MKWHEWVPQGGSGDGSASSNQKVKHPSMPRPHGLEISMSPICGRHWRTGRLTRKGTRQIRWIVSVM